MFYCRIVSQTKSLLIETLNIRFKKSKISKQVEVKKCAQIVLLRGHSNNTLRDWPRGRQSTTGTVLEFVISVVLCLWK
jgi:hypothetical protein